MKNWDLALGVRNLLDEDVRESLPEQGLPAIIPWKDAVCMPSFGFIINPVFSSVQAESDLKFLPVNHS